MEGQVRRLDAAAVHLLSASVAIIAQAGAGARAKCSRRRATRMRADDARIALSCEDNGRVCQRPA